MAEERLERKVTVILATDVAGYSKHVEKDESLTIKVIDKGKGFDTSNIKIPNIETKLKTSERKRGWGIMLIKELMDSVDFESSNDGTTLTMVKNKIDNE